MGISKTHLVSNLQELLVYWGYRRKIAITQAPTGWRNTGGAGGVQRRGGYR